MLLVTSLRSSGVVANGDWDLPDVIDGRSYRLQCRSACRTLQAENYMGERLLTQRS